MTTTPEEICSNLRSSLIRSGLHSANGDSGAEGDWRIAPQPYYITPGELEFFTQLGGHILKFYQALNRLYFDSLKDIIPSWFAQYLDMGKPADLLDYARMNRFKNQLPGILRPDVIVTADGFSVTELDSVPGGFGLLANLMSFYATTHENIVGADIGGIPDRFYGMIESFVEKKGGTLAIAVSEESKDYLAEMQYLGSVLREKGFPVYVTRPGDIIFKEEGLYLRDGDREVKLDAIYRFFELFDLKNIPKSELLLYSNKKAKVKITPPCKPFLEEKLTFALFHHPFLNQIWEKSLGAETFILLKHLIPETWILDNRPLPPYAVIPGLQVGGRSVREWSELFHLTQKEREMAIKVSGFSPLAWGGRGVTIGHDISAEIWRETVDASLKNFEWQPSILQMFRKGKRVKMSYLTATGYLRETECRVRLTPYYFVEQNTARLSGILATLCPKNKKKIHGMTEAILVPCAVKNH